MVNNKICRINNLISKYKQFTTKIKATQYCIGIFKTPKSQKVLKAHLRALIITSAKVCNDLVLEYESVDLSPELKELNIATN